ncbi:MAG: 3-phosphoshikimate 1-carboxyvinyltransferase [Desulfococcaceae bacterium]|jgi:3-phosphoshikimate 1-carboxyvinyltransferase|nr:3-phosphoshikimate 1-carboxyvinyltransferase [Desulfococcaceae bacterium]
MIEIKPQKTIQAEITVPGSKSYTHRTFIAAALSDGPCTVSNALRSEDTLLTLDALKAFGVSVEDRNGQFIINGTSGNLTAADEIYLANSGTSMRLLTAIAALAKGRSILTGTERMKERPIRDLLEALTQAGVEAKSLAGNGCPPVEIIGGDVKGGKVQIRCAVSSQYLSGLLLMAPCTKEGMEIQVTEGPVSKPYIDLTVDIMQRFGISLERKGYEYFSVPGKQSYRSGSFTVEGDASNASYFWAAAAVTGGKVKVRGINGDSRQGDVRLTECFEQMGCRIIREKDGITLIGGKLRGIETDMGNMPDVAPTLAVVAAFAEGTTLIRNVAHLKAKECDRLTAVATELSKMGADITATEDSLIIRGGNPLHGAEIETYKDHRMAMCMAVAGLKVPGVRITDEMCVEKSFPDFWEVFANLYTQ